MKLDAFIKSLIVLVMLLLKVLTATPVLAIDTSVEINSGNAIILSPGGTREDIALGIKNIPELGAGNGVGGFTFRLNWDKDVINVSNVTGASFPGFTIIPGVPDNVNGVVVVSGYMSTTPLTGNAAVAAINILAVGTAGTSSGLNVTVVSLGDKDGNPITGNPVNAAVHVLSIPGVSTDNATGVTGTTATLNGTLTADGGEACQYRFCRGTTSGAYTDNTSWIGSTATGQSFSDNITTLATGTKYYYIAECRNGLGTGSGSERSFTTNTDNSPAIANNPATNITATSATLNGDLISDSGEATTVRIYGGPADGGTNPGNWEQDEYIGVMTAGVFYKDIKGLRPGTRYYYRCYAENTEGSAWATESASFITQSTWAAYWDGPGKDWWRFSSGGP